MIDEVEKEFQKALIFQAESDKAGHCQSISAKGEIMVFEALAALDPRRSRDQPNAF